MANYSANDAIVYAREFVKGIPVSGVDAQTCDVIQTMIWDFYPWHFTLKQKTKVGDAFLTDKTQDITGVPTDFYRLIFARLTRTDLTDGNYYRELTAVQELHPCSPDMIADYTAHEFIAYIPELSVFRLEGQIQIATGTELTRLDIEYQKSPTKITAANIQTPFTSMQDWFYPVFLDGVLWRLMVLANDKRQGAMQITKAGNAVYTGQMGVFYNGMIARALTERQMYASFRYPANGSIGAGAQNGGGNGRWPF